MGAQALAARPVAVHTYVAVVVVLEPPPSEYPLAQPTETDAVVTPMSDDKLVLDRAVVAQLTAAK